MARKFRVKATNEIELGRYGTKDGPVCTARKYPNRSVMIGVEMGDASFELDPDQFWAFATDAMRAATILELHG